MTTSILSADLLHLIALMSPERVLRIQAVARLFRFDATANFHGRRAARVFLESSPPAVYMFLMIGRGLDGTVEGFDTGGMDLVLYDNNTIKSRIAIKYR